MPQLKILNTKEIKQILKLIENQWNAKLKLDYAFLKNNKSRVFIVNKDISTIDLEKLRINSIGMYFCETRNNEIRLSIEGSQLVGPKASKNIIEIDEEQTKQWLKGEDLEIMKIREFSGYQKSEVFLSIKENDYSEFLIIKHNNYFLGTGKYKENKILNYVSKSRRINTNS
jgi:NOL1/NOP2/fmu family ribosome biogenesis protein|tara:strand:+ start:11049 stop:11561 length:513 start_codon:yes stop_codon:yes gene_type:complete